MEKWKSVFKIMGWTLISIAIIDLICALNNESFMVSGYFSWSDDEFDLSLFMAYLIATSTPVVTWGIGLLFGSDLVDFLIENQNNVAKLVNREEEKSIEETQSL